MMKKYYGFIYNGINATYDFENGMFFKNPFEALKNANNEWNSNPDYQIPRLLVVIELEDIDHSTPLFRYAFFQFTNSKSCENFIIDQNKIIWSNAEDLIWNGNARMM